MTIKNATNIKDISSPEAIQAASRFIDRIKSGSLKKRILPNTGKPFDDLKVMKRFEKVCKSDIMDELAKKIND